MTSWFFARVLNVAGAQVLTKNFTSAFLKIGLIYLEVDKNSVLSLLL